jgi:hypothetical protein
MIEAGANGIYLNNAAGRTVSGKLLHDNQAALLAYKAVFF